MIRNAMNMIVVVTAIALGGTVFSTAAVARGGGLGGGHFAGVGHFGGVAGHMSGHFGGLHGGLERRGFGAHAYSPSFCNYPYRSDYPGCL